MEVFITICILWLIYKFLKAIGSADTAAKRTKAPSSYGSISVPSTYEDVTIEDCYDDFDDDNISARTLQAIRTIVRAKALEFNASSFVVRTTFDEYGNQQYEISIQVDGDNIHALNDSLEDTFGDIINTMEVTRNIDKNTNLTTMNNSNPIQQINIKTNYGSLNGDTTNNFYGKKESDNKDYTDYEEIKETDTSSINHPLPPELSTEKAMVLWQHLQTAGVIDDNYQPTGLFVWQQVLLADAIAKHLGIHNKWKVFGSLWSIKDMKQQFQKAMAHPDAPTFYKRLQSLNL